MIMRSAYMLTLARRTYLDTRHRSRTHHIVYMNLVRIPRT